MTSVEVKDGSGCSIQLLEVDGKLFPAFPVENIKAYRQLPLRDDDVLLCAYPKSGTHWLWEVCMMLRRGDAQTVPFKKSLQMIEFNSLAEIGQFPSPRVLNTHMLYEALPAEALTRGTRLVLVLRNAKDVAVSFYSHTRKLDKYYQYQGSFPDYLQLFMQGKVDFGSWFDYVNSWDEVLSRGVKNPILVIMYEDMKENPVREITRLEDFLGLPPNPELVDKVAQKCDFSRMSEDKKPHQDHAELLYRKGMVGDWKNHFTVAESEAFDALFQQKMKDSRFKFRYTL